MTVFRTFAAITLGMLLLTRPVIAQEELDELPESTEKIQLEVLVFRFVGKGQGAQMASGQTPVSASGVTVAGSGSGDYVNVDSSQRALAGAHARLQASSDLKPIYFSAWQQNLSDQRWVAITATGSDGEKLSGRVLLTPGKPLGLKLELQLDNAVVQGSADARFRLKANRPAHFDETIYFDHPALGALVRVEQKSADTAVN
jgi:hypothetical protein